MCALAMKILAARANWKVTGPPIWRNVLSPLTGAQGFGLRKMTWTLWWTAAPTKYTVKHKKSFVTSLKILSRTSSAGLAAVLAMAVTPVTFSFQLLPVDRLFCAGPSTNEVDRRPKMLTCSQHCLIVELWRQKTCHSRWTVDIIRTKKSRFVDLSEFPCFVSLLVELNLLKQA